MKKKYKIIALIGPSGAGKDSLVRALETYLDKDIDYHSIISLTTRPPRDYEVNGKDYYFVDDFSQYDMLETSSFNNWHYGTATEMLREDIVNVGVFNPEGIRSLIKHPEVDLETYYIKVEPKERLIRQLKREENPNIDEIMRRWKTDKEDFDNLDFEYKTIENDDFIDAKYALIHAVLRAE